MLRQAGAETGQCEAQLQALGQLQRRVEGASPTALASLRAQITAMVAATQITSQQALAAAGVQNGGASLGTATETTRATVSDFTRDFYERKIFDSYLRFSSNEDEDAYRKREAERRAAIDKAMAKDTPQGTLEANRLAIEQIRDAGVHGADRSPEYPARLARLEHSDTALSAALAAQTAAPPTTAKALPTDPLDGVAPSHVDPAILAALRGAGITTPDPTGQGHGVGNIAAASASALAR